MADHAVVADDEVDLSRRKFLTRATIATGAVGAAFVAVPFIEYWSPSERARAQGVPTDEDRPRPDGDAGMAPLPHLRGETPPRHGGPHRGPRRGAQGPRLALFRPA